MIFIKRISIVRKFERNVKNYKKMSKKKNVSVL